MKSSTPRAAPNACSPSAATFVSRSRNAGRSRPRASSAAIGTSRNCGPRLGVSRTTPVRGSTGPGDEIPIPAMLAATSEPASCRARVAASMHRATMTEGPCSVGVGRSLRVSRVPSGSMTAARMRVPPRSTAMTGREDRAKPLRLIVEKGLDSSRGPVPDPLRQSRSRRSGGAAARRSAGQTKTPAGVPAGVEWYR